MTRPRRSTRPPAASARTRATTSSPGLLVSNGDPGTDGILGAKNPNARRREVALVLHPAARRQHDVGSALQREGPRTRRRLTRRRVEARRSCRRRRPGGTVVWCQSTIRPSRTRKSAAARLPGRRSDGPAAPRGGRRRARRVLPLRRDGDDPPAAGQRCVPLHGVGMVARHELAVLDRLCAPSAKARRPPRCRCGRARRSSARDRLGRAASWPPQAVRATQRSERSRRASPR